MDERERERDWMREREREIGRERLEESDGKREGKNVRHQKCTKS